MRTAIFKEPTDAPLHVGTLNLDGDRQADLSVHGGPDKAVYAYPAEHYAFWRRELGRDLAWGSFGENLTVEGLPFEDEVFLGDRIRAGTAELVVTQPRLPCFKLGIRFGDPTMVKRFLRAARTGYYLRVVRAGTVRRGDAVELAERHPDAVPVSEITRIYATARDDAAGLARLLATEALPGDWRRYLADLLGKARPAA